MTEAEYSQFSSIYGDGYEGEGMDEWDPTSMHPDATPTAHFNANKPNEEGYLTITVTRYGGTGVARPWQLFGASFGIAQTDDSNLFPSTVPFSYELTGEIDAALKGITEVYDAAWGQATFAAAAAYVTANLNAATAVYYATFTAQKKAIWLADGSLQIGDDNAGVRIQCQEVPYKLLVESMKTTTMLISHTKFSYLQSVSLDQRWLIQDKSFLGATAQNQVTPRSDFDPYQQQANIVESNSAIWITNERSINGLMDQAETQISWVMYVKRYSKNALLTSHAGHKPFKKVAGRPTNAKQLHGRR